MLDRLVPRLKIAERSRLKDKFLVVRGDVRIYKIHLGNSNILIEPNDQYLCIVPATFASCRRAAPQQREKVRRIKSSFRSKVITR